MYWLLHASYVHGIESTCGLHEMIWFVLALVALYMKFHSWFIGPDRLDRPKRGLAGANAHRSKMTSNEGQLGSRDSFFVQG